MFETYLTVIGTVVTEPAFRSTAGGELVSFRVAGNSRRRDRASGDWTNGPTLYLTVTCWRNLVSGVRDAELRRGAPIIAHGQVSTNEYVAGDGITRSDLVMTADAVGVDLARVSWLRRSDGGAPPADAARGPLETTGPLATTPPDPFAAAQSAGTTTAA